MPSEHDRKDVLAATISGAARGAAVGAGLLVAALIVIALVLLASVLYGNLTNDNSEHFRQRATWISAILQSPQAVVILICAAVLIGGPVGSIAGALIGGLSAAFGTDSDGPQQERQP